MSDHDEPLGLGWRTGAAESSPLAASEDLLDAVVNSTTDLIWAVDVPSFRLRAYNRGLRDYYRRDHGRSLVLGMGQDELLPDAEAARRWCEFYERALTAGDFETEYQTVVGERTLELRFSVLRREGQPYAVAVFGQDVTARKLAEQALSESEQKFRLLFENASDAILLMQGDRITDCNARALEVFGCQSADQILGRSPSDFSPPRQPCGRESGELASDLIQAALAGQPQFFEWSHQRPDGTPWPAEVSLNSIRLGGQVLLQAIVRDVSERRRAAQQIALLTQSIDVHRDGAYWFDSDNRCVYVNAAGCQALGYTREELIGQSIGDFVPAATQERLDTIRQILRAQGFYISESVHRRKDGSEFAVEVMSALIHLDGREYYCGFARDITERKQAEQALRSREETLRSVLRAAPVGIVLVVDRIVRSANERCCELLGCAPDEMIGHSTERWYESEAERERVRKLLYDHLAGHDLCTVATRLRRTDGALLDVVLSASPLAPGDISAGAVVAIHDVTAAKQEEARRLELEAQLAQAQKMESIGRLAGGVAHDFNNVLQAILANAEMLAGDFDPEAPCQAHVAEVLTATQRAASLTRQLLTFARKQKVEPRVLDLNQAVGEIHNMLRRLIGEHIKLTWQPGSGQCRVLIDPSQLDQVLANLVVNARDAIADHGTIIVETATCVLDDETVSAHGEVPCGDYVVLSVSDTGCGMDGDTMARIFEPFFTTKELGQGTGLGLATVHGIVHQHQGFLSVYSEPGCGTTFRIYLPRSTAEPAAGPHRTAAQQLGRGETVLVVDDDAALLKACCQTLERLGYGVLSAGSASEALALVEGHDGPIHLLLADVVMPQTSGPRLAAQLAVLQPNLKCLFMSGYAAELLVATSGLGEDLEVISKPFSAASLAARLRGLLDRG